MPGPPLSLCWPRSPLCWSPPPLLGLLCSPLASSLSTPASPPHRPTALSQLTGERRPQPRTPSECSSWTCCAHALQHPMMRLKLVMHAPRGRNAPGNRIYPEPSSRSCGVTFRRPGPLMRWLWGAHIAISRGSNSVLPPPPPTPLSPRDCAYDPRVQWKAQSGVRGEGRQKASRERFLGVAARWLAVCGRG